jgi:hypothetical protein
MNTKVRKSFLVVAAVGLIGLLGHAASANVSSVPGSSFSADAGSQQQFFDILPGSWDARRNDASFQLAATGQVPFQSSNALFITGGISQNSNFRAIVSNGVGNAAWIGQLVVGQQPGIAVNTLALGTPPLFAGSALVVKASLQPQAWIGLVWQ